MPRALAIETSGRVGSVALSIDGVVARERQFEHGLQNAAKILPIIDELCREQGWAPREIDEVYVSVGPGSFTGLRIGVTIAKTLALTTGAKIVAVPSMRVLAHNAPTNFQHIVVMLDAKRGQVFAARFQRDTSGLVEVEPAHLDRLIDVLSRSPRPVYAIVQGVTFDAKDIVTDESSCVARASAVVEIGAAMSARGEFTDADRLTPIYIRLSEAEEKWNQQLEAPPGG